MSHADHEWARELIPAHLAGGLNAEERARLEAHASGCAECIAELDALRRFDRGLEAMFAPVRPSPGLEERVIRAVRSAPVQAPKSTASRFGQGIAAVFILGLVGFAVLNYAEDGGPVFALSRAKHRPGSQLQADAAPATAPKAMGYYDFASDGDARAPNDTKAAPSTGLRVVDIEREYAPKRLPSAGELARARTDAAKEDVAGRRARSNPAIEEERALKGESKEYLSYGKPADETVQNYPSSTG
ncbi:MAG TPA: zf-HC2 domain-containing protein, partial [Planctomycetota bacterium]|nr:zf-HC2 domain-containing protein [Planctomycetota bacterium]